jgi:hypothetical protein
MTGRANDRSATKELEQLRRTRQARVEGMLHQEMAREAPGNAAYWVAVVAGSFVLNLLVLLAIAR